MKLREGASELRGEEQDALDAALAVPLWHDDAPVQESSQPDFKCLTTVQQSGLGGSHNAASIMQRAATPWTCLLLDRPRSILACGRGRSK